MANGLVLKVVPFTMRKKLIIDAYCRLKAIDEVLRVSHRASVITAKHTDVFWSTRAYDNELKEQNKKKTQKLLCDGRAMHRARDPRARTVLAPEGRRRRLRFRHPLSPTLPLFFLNSAGLRRGSEEASRPGDWDSKRATDRVPAA